MAALRPSAVLLLSCALLVGASYYRQLDVFSAGPLSESAAPSRLSCVVWCEMTSGCVGFTFTAGGSCQLFNGVLRSDADTSNAVPVGYSRPTASPCPSGWNLYRDKCYTRIAPAVEQTCAQFRVTCQSLADAADLAVPDDNAEAMWMVHHPSRPLTGECTGLEIVAGTIVKMDGTTHSYQVALDTVVDPGCVVLRSARQQIGPFKSVSLSKVREGYVCEAPSSCSSVLPCPAGWLALDDYCYHYVSTGLAWQAADDHCAGLQQGARLSPVINMETFRVVYYSLGLASSTWAGISDTEVEGTWKSVDGSVSSFAWRSTEDPNGGTAENCVEMNTSGGNDAPCSGGRAFVCRVPAGVCG